MMISIKLAKHKFDYFVCFFFSNKEKLMYHIFPSGTRVLTGPIVVQLPANENSYSYIYRRVFRERRERSPPLPKIVLPS
jgi:hypothetical protein